jgi:hypothetical protein
VSLQTHDSTNCYNNILKLIPLAIPDLSYIEHEYEKYPRYDSEFADYFID